MLSKLNRLDEASDLAQRAYDKAKAGQNQTVMGQSLLVLARIAITQKKFDRAVALLSELDPLMHRILPPGHYAFSVLTTDRAMLALGQGNISRAMDLSNQAVAIGEAAIAKSKAGSFTFSTLLLNDSLITLAAGKPEQALADADRLLSMEQSSNQQGALSAKAGNAYLARARALQALGRHDEARAAAQVAVERLERSVGPDHPETQSARQLATPSSENR
jgi:tetratricopeptide (TPR) repeat protein